MCVCVCREAEKDCTQDFSVARQACGVYRLRSAGERGEIWGPEWGGGRVESIKIKNFLYLRCQSEACL